MNDARVPRRSALQTAATPPCRLGRSRVAATNWPTREGEVVFKNFRFRDGEVLPELRMHYATLGSRTATRRGRSTMR